MNSTHSAGSARVSVAAVPEYAEWRDTNVFLTEKTGISGICCLASSDRADTFMVVHDNKRRDEPRLGIIESVRGGNTSYRGVAWPAGTPDPIDLEAISLVPQGRELHVLATTSRGLCYELAVSPNYREVALVRQFTLPGIGSRSNIESCSLYPLGNGCTLIAWAERGDGLTEGATLVVGTLDQFGNPAPKFTAIISAFFPEEATRHISDLAFRSDGALFAVAATDEGNEGPFSGYLSRIGKVTPAGSRFGFEFTAVPAPHLVRIGVKFEALTFLPRSDIPVIGTDDESFGGRLLVRNRAYPVEEGGRAPVLGDAAFGVQRRM